MKEVVIIIGGRGRQRNEYVGSELPGCAYFAGDFFYPKTDAKPLRRAFNGCADGGVFAVGYAVLGWDECEAILKCLGVRKARVVEISGHGEGSFGVKCGMVFLSGGGSK